MQTGIGGGMYAHYQNWLTSGYHGEPKVSCERCQIGKSDSPENPI
jgi:hypothetical protein